METENFTMNDIDIKKTVSQYIESKNYDEAYQFLVQQIPEHSTNPEFWNFFGCTLHSFNEFFAAISAFKKAISLDSRNPDSWQNLAFILFHKSVFGLHNEALKCLQICLQLNPTSSPAIKVLNEYNSTQRFLNHRFFVSYPKCGRNWFRYGMTKALEAHFGISMKFTITTIHHICSKVGIDPIFFNHDQAEWGPFRDSYNCLPEIERRGMIPDWTGMTFSQQSYENSNVIFMIRSPLDILVSSYLELSKVSKIYKGSMSEFIQDPHFGIKKILNFYKLWDQNKEKTKDFLLLRYEEMHKNFFEVMKKACSFLDLADVQDHSIKQACELTTLKNMKKAYSAMSEEKESDPDAQKIRRGKIDGYTDYLSSHDILYVYKMIEEIGCPFYEFHYENGKINLSWK